MAFKSSLRSYYYLTKPGIIYGNLVTVLAGFLFACRWRISLELLVSTLVGTGLIIGSGCVFNNYIDRKIDRKMARTEKRALATGRISGPRALTYGVALGCGGFLILAAKTNFVTVLLGAVGLIDYVILYGFFKRRGPIGTLVGSVSGATPIAAGYTAVIGRFDISALLLFVILVAWQMPHFYAIAIYRQKDYRAARIPVLPVAKNITLAKQRSLIYIVGLIVALILLKTSGGAGYVYLAIALITTVAWLNRGYGTLKLADDAAWGKQMFRFSLLVICGLSLAISLGTLLP